MALGKGKGKQHTLSLCESITAKGHWTKKKRMQQKIMLMPNRPRNYKHKVSDHTAVLKSHNMTFPSYEAESKWNHDLGCHLQAVIQDEWDANWKTGAKVPVEEGFATSARVKSKKMVDINFERKELHCLPGLRGSHILRIGSEPPAATRAEFSPPTSRQFKTFSQTYIMHYFSTTWDRMSKEMHHARC